MEHYNQGNQINKSLEQTPRVPQLLEEGEKAIIDLGQTVAALENRLRPVLRMEPQPPTGGAQGMPERSPQLTDILALQVAAVRGLTQQVVNITRRLEV